MGGFVKMAREFDGAELVGIESPLWPKTYMGSGWTEPFLGTMRLDAMPYRNVDLKRFYPYASRCFRSDPSGATRQVRD